MKVETLIIAIFISLASGGVAGGFIGYNLAPKTINNIQNVYTSNNIRSENQNIQTSFQGQITLISPVTNLSINIKGITNISVRDTTNSNYTSITNVVN